MRHVGISRLAVKTVTGGFVLTDFDSASAGCDGQAWDREARELLRRRALLQLRNVCLKVKLALLAFEGFKLGCLRVGRGEGRCQFPMSVNPAVNSFGATAAAAAANASAIPES
jgi:hypothetical protein